jgi:hypothetical protein
MSVIEVVGLTIAILLMGYLARHMLELGSNARNLPRRPVEPQPLHDPLTMAWEEAER